VVSTSSTTISIDILSKLSSVENSWSIRRTTRSAISRSGRTSSGEEMKTRNVLRSASATGLVLCAFEPECTGWWGAVEVGSSLRSAGEALGTTVLDWKDFTPGRSILQQIEGAAERCNAGIFLFTEDDKLPTSAFPNQAAPRDSVVFEAGYFINSKGKDHVLIIQEAGAKTPAELGGDIYGSLEDKSNIATIEETVRKFVKAL
jgi:hypothetical protein